MAKPKVLIEYAEVMPHITVTPSDSVEIELRDLRETDYLILEYNGISIYQTEKSCSLSDCWVATRYNCGWEDEDAFDYRALTITGIPSRLEEKYEKLFPDDDRNQILAYHIDTGDITEDGLSPTFR